jgi:hypothetical protein
VSTSEGVTGTGPAPLNGAHSERVPTREPRTPWRSSVWAVVTVAVVVLIVVVAAVRFWPSNPGTPGLPRILSVVPESSDQAARVAGGLLNNTPDGPWSLALALGWDNTAGLGQVPYTFGNGSCPLENAAISGYGVLGSNTSYSTGLAEGWLLVFVSPYEGATNLIAWVGDGTAYMVGELVGAECARLPSFVPSSTVYTSTGAAGAATTARNFTRFATTYTSANATYEQSWTVPTLPAKPVAYWQISFNVCNGTVPEASNTVLYGANGTLISSTYGEAGGAICGSSDAEGGGTPEPARTGGAPGLPALGEVPIARWVATSGQRP